MDVALVWRAVGLPAVWRVNRRGLKSPTTVMFSDSTRDRGSRRVMIAALWALFFPVDRPP